VGNYEQVSTLIGYGSPNKVDTHDVHGAPLGKDETAATRANLKWEYGEFEVPQDVYDLFKEAGKRGAAAEAKWKENLEAYKQKYPAVRPSFTPAHTPSPLACVRESIWLAPPSLLSRLSSSFLKFLNIELEEASLRESVCAWSSMALSSLSPSPLSFLHF
jgi:Transketolase, thiamine diphosphate binding domain